VQARRCDTPLRTAYVTCSGRAGTLTIFCGDFLHHFDLEVALGHEFLQARVLLLELLSRRKSSGWNVPNRFFHVYTVWPLTLCRFATAGTPSRSASRMTATICSSVNLDLRMLPLFPGAGLSRNRWSEKKQGRSAPRRGQLGNQY
jgi:hypothetical protein